MKTKIIMSTLAGAAGRGAPGLRAMLKYASAALVVAVITTVAPAGAVGAGPPRSRPSLVTASGATSASEPCIRNGRIAFVRDFPRAGRNDIYTIRPSGRGLKRITDTGSAWSPAWSPDGKYLLYEGKRDGEPDVEIYRIDPDGSNPVKLTDNDWSDATPAWSPDGEWIAFASLSGPNDWDFEIFEMRSDGSGLTQVTDNDVNDWTPKWSPNGRRIVYGSNDKIKVMNRDGTGVRRISRRGPAGNPDWRPQGRWIVFQADHYDSPGVEEIWMMRADGSDRRRVTRRPGPDQAPVWSPDGARIAYSKDWNLAVMRRDGSRSRAIHQGKGDVYAPDWQPRCTASVR